jgi:hypothetical protein
MEHLLERRTAVEDVCECESRKTGLEEATGNSGTDGPEPEQSNATTTRRHVTNSLISP